MQHADQVGRDVVCRGAQLCRAGAGSQVSHRRGVQGPCGARAGL